MVFDLVCRRCGAYGQSRWDPSGQVAVTRCGSCGSGMSVIGIDFPAGRGSVSLDGVLHGIQEAGVVPLAIERHGRRRRVLVH
jgi:predicted aconitase with swiveling domain